MRVRMTVEYDTDETLEYERHAWEEGDCSFLDFLSLNNFGDDDISIKFEEVK